ncbi:hypothetical protein GUJ93_ZPchr0006g46044 [Zizania palustris]|uniref:Uncharacterized protein n=1 Tax=Zizania palustris TaxID=103762 RepID=A0A8J5W3V6_ZIZPA|nr:hypothetical protein GUJ93_ZPchr0006g46044 [Zizania palustris]
MAALHLCARPFRLLLASVCVRLYRLISLLVLMNTSCWEIIFFRLSSLPSPLSCRRRRRRHHHGRRTTFVAGAGLLLPPPPLPSLSPSAGWPVGTVVARSSTAAPKSGAAMVGSDVDAVGSAPGGLAAGGVFTFTTPVASSPFPAAPPLGSVSCGLDAIARSPCSLFPVAPPLGSAASGMDAAASSLSSPFGGLAATRSPSFLVPPLMATAPSSFLALPLVAGLGATTAGSLYSFLVMPLPMAAAPKAGSSPVLAAAGWPGTTDVVAADAALAAALTTAKTATTARPPMRWPSMLRRPSTTSGLLFPLPLPSRIQLSS